MSHVDREQNHSMSSNAKDNKTLNLNAIGCIMFEAYTITT